jgi:hypothetical protein
MEKNKAVSIADDREEEMKGACHHVFLLTRLKTNISINCAVKKAVPDAIAILISASQIERTTPTQNPPYTTFRAFEAPKERFITSVTRNAIG